MLFGRGSKVCSDIEVEVVTILHQSFALVPLDIRIQYQSVFLVRNTKHQLLIEIISFSLVSVKLILGHQGVIGESVLPCTSEFFPRAGEFLCYREYVDRPCSRLYSLNDHVFLVERCAVEDDLSVYWIQSLHHALVNSILNGIHGGFGDSISISNQVIKDGQGRALTEDLGTTDTCSSTIQLHTQRFAILVFELKILVCELGFWHPLLHEFTVGVTELNILSGVLYTVINGIRYIDEPPDLTHEREFTKHSQIQGKVFHEYRSLGSTTKQQIHNVLFIGVQLIQHGKVNRGSLVSFSFLTIHQFDEVHKLQRKLRRNIIP